MRKYYFKEVNQSNLECNVWGFLAYTCVLKYVIGKTKGKTKDSYRNIVSHQPYSLSSSLHVFSPRDKKWKENRVWGSGWGKIGEEVGSGLRE